MTDVAAPNERDPEIHEAFLSLACAPMLRLLENDQEARELCPCEGNDVVEVRL